MSTVLVPQQLRRLSAGEGRISVEGATLRQIFRDLRQRHPALYDRVIADDRIALGISLAINDNVVSTGLSERVPDGAEITIVPQISGGDRRTQGEGLPQALAIEPGSARGGGAFEGRAPQVRRALRPRRGEGEPLPD